MENPITIQDLEKSFDEKVNELRRENNWLGTDSPVHEFGYKTKIMVMDKEGHLTVEVYTTPDWGNIKKFFTSSLTKALEQMRRDKVPRRDCPNTPPCVNCQKIDAQNLAVQDSNNRLDNMLGKSTTDQKLN